MEMFLKDGNGQLIATYTRGVLYVVPGADRQMVAFAFFKLMNEALNPVQGVSVTWGTQRGASGMGMG